MIATSEYGHDAQMARNLGSQSELSAPPAQRAAPPGWRDPRLWIGVAIVAVSVVAGARLLGSADDTVSVWAVSSDMGPGDEVSENDLIVHRIQFADDSELDRYFSVDDELPADLELSRGVGAGELLPRGAVGSAAETDTLQVPVAVDAEQVPVSVEDGSVVDIYLVPSAAAPPRGEGAAGAGGAARPAGEPGPALEGVTVIDAPRLEESFGTSGKRQLVLAVTEEAARRFFALLGSSDNPVITVVRRG